MKMRKISRTRLIFASLGLLFLILALVLILININVEINDPLIVALILVDVSYYFFILFLMHYLNDAHDILKRMSGNQSLTTEEEK